MRKYTKNEIEEIIEKAKNEIEEKLTKDKDGDMLTELMAVKDKFLINGLCLAILSEFEE